MYPCDADVLAGSKQPVLVLSWDIAFNDASLYMFHRP